MNDVPLSLEHQFDLTRCEIYLQQQPEKAASIALMQFRFHLERLEECQRLEAENQKLKSLSLPPFSTRSHGQLQTEYDDLRLAYLKVTQENARLRQDKKDLMQLIDSLTKEDDVSLPDFIQQILD